MSSTNVPLSFTLYDEASDIVVNAFAVASYCESCQCLCDLEVSSIERNASQSLEQSSDPDSLAVGKDLVLDNADAIIDMALNTSQTELHILRNRR